MHEDSFFEEEIPTSKSQLKREMHERQAIGESLIKLKPSQLDGLTLSEKLVEAILEAPRITQKNARRRYLNYIGKLMRDVDIEQLKAELNHMEEQAHYSKKQVPIIEKWVTDLVQGDESKLEVFISQHPGCDIQHLRQLVRNAKRELNASDEKTKNTSRKKLFTEIQAIRKQNQID